MRPSLPPLPEHLRLRSPSSAVDGDSTAARRSKPSEDTEGSSPADSFNRPRFFSFWSDGRLRLMLSRHGHVERFNRWSTDRQGVRTYQGCSTRAPSAVADLIPGAGPAVLP